MFSEIRTATFSFGKDERLSSRLLWNPKVQFHVYKSSLPASVLCNTDLCVRDIEGILLVPGDVVFDDLIFMTYAV